jgi:hypothetical protein
LHSQFPFPILNSNRTIENLAIKLLDMNRISIQRVNPFD